MYPRSIYSLTHAWVLVSRAAVFARFCTGAWARALGIGLLIGVFSVAGPRAQAQESTVKTATWQRLTLGSAEQPYVFPVYSNRALGGDMSGIRRVLLIQHGRARDGDAYYLAAERLMQTLGVDSTETLLVSPQFFSPAQVAKAMLNDFPAWGTAGFAGGEDSASPPRSVSSFQVFDDLLALFSDRRRFPALRSIVLAGHSGGAVLVQQFAVLNHIDERVRAAGIDMRYVVANASAFLYFNDRRPSGDGFSTYDAARCATYNDHRYGFNKIVRYAMNEAPADAFKRYMQRSVFYLFGTEDVDPNHPALDKSCAAAAQGGNRLERGRNYLRHERDLASANGIAGVHRSFEVLGVGHDQQAMLGSACGARILFDTNANERGIGAQCVETAAK
jgi:hypothetical protein